ncbi:hypothetical protein ACOMHN_014266 [Nucella lapillus]
MLYPSDPDNDTYVPCPPKTITTANATSGNVTWAYNHLSCVQEFNGLCIPTFLVNNGEKDCILGEDENIPIHNISCPGYYRYFLMGLYLMTIGVADVKFKSNYVAKEGEWTDSVACTIAGCLSFVSSEVSAFLLCIITLDRVLAICFPLNLNVHFSSQVTVLFWCMIWTTGITLASVPLISGMEFYGVNGICLPLPITRKPYSGQGYAFSVFIVLNFTIFVFISVGQLLIFRAIRKTRATAGHKKQHKDMTIARRLFLLVFSDFCCWFPVDEMGLLAFYGIPIPSQLNVWTAIFVLPINSAVNPFLYTLKGAPSTGTTAPAVQVAQLRWMRMANNQLVLAQVPVIGQSPPGIVQPVQPHMGSATPPAAAAPPAQPRVTPEKPSWTTLAAVSPEEHKQRWLRMANNQLVLAQVPVIGQGSPGIVQPVKPHMGSATPPAAAGPPAQPRVTPEKPSWTTLAAVSPEEHKQRWLRMANNQLVLAQVPVIGQGSPGIVQPVQPHMGSATPPAAAGPPVQPRVTPEKPSWTTLAAVSPEEHKQMIGERLHTQIHQIYPGLTKKITGMLLEMDNKDLLRLLESPEMLKSSADDAAKVLQQHVMMKPSLTTDLLEPFPTAQQKQMLGERMFPKIQRLQPSLAGKITGMLLNLDNPQVLELLEDGQLLKTRAEEAVVVLIQAHLEEHLSAQASGKRSLSGALTGVDSSSGDVSERQSLTGGRLLSEEKFGKESVMLGGCVGKERVVNASVSLENPPPKNQETSSLVLGISGQRSSCENVRNEELSEKGELGAPSTAEDISVPLSVTGSNLQRLMLSDISGTKLLATDTPAIQTLTDNVEQSYPPSSNVLDFSEIVSERRPLKDETIKSRSLVDEICDTSLARGRFTEAVWAALSPIEDDPERLSLIADQKMQSLTGHVTAPQQRNSMPEERPLSDTAPGEPLLTENVSEKQLTDDVLAGDLISRTRIPGRQSMSENFPETLSRTQGTFGGPPANKAGDVSENQTVCGSDPVSQTWGTMERQSQSDDNQSSALPSDLQELQKEALREQLQPVVEGLYPGLGREVCQILLTRADPGELSAIMMRHPDILRAKVAEAASALQTAHQQMLMQSMMIQQQQTQILSQRLYAMIQPAYPELAAQLTGVLLERGVWEVAEMVQRPQVLASRLGQALALVQVHRRPPFTAQALELFPPTMHKQILADRLLPLVQTYRPDGARQITSMLLTLENWKLIDMLNNPEMLHGTVDNAVRYLPQITHAGGLQIAEARIFTFFLL